MNEPLKISELIKHLQKLKKEHGDLPCLATRCSDYTSLEAHEITVVTAHRKTEWFLRHHPSLCGGEKFVHFEGN